jgi:uncharacterized membrane protein
VLAANERTEEEPMHKVSTSIEVQAPLRDVYDQWTQFEDFPHFMEGVKSVTQTDDTHLHWVAEVGGHEKEWDAEIHQQVPDKVVAWKSTGGAKNDGAVTFEPMSDGATRVALEMQVEPDGVLESVGEALGVLDRRVRGDLERFKKFIEARTVPTGAWRGTVSSGR